jgi:CRP-like cAMP-binding protein
VNRPKPEELRSIQFFSDMSKRDLRMVARFASTKTHGKGEYIIRENTVADTFYIIRKGKVRGRGGDGPGHAIRRGILRRDGPPG